MRERIKGFDETRIELVAEARSLGSDIADTKLDIGDIDKEVNEVAATPDTQIETTAAPTGSEQLNDALSLIDLEERAGQRTPESARAARIATLEGALQGMFGELSPREWLEATAQLREAQQANTQAVTDNTSELKELKASIDRQNAINESVVGVGLREAQRALADIITGQLGYRTQGRALVSGSGAAARY